MWWELGEDSCILYFFGMLIWILGDMWILGFCVFDILLKCGCLLIWMWDIRLLNCHPFVFFLDIKEEIVALCLFLGQKEGETLQLLFWWLDIHMLMIILDIGYFEIHVDMWSCLIWILIYIRLFGYTCWYIMYIQLLYTGATHCFVCELQLQVL